eukprot:COSAG02_NODE_39689_length_414_cov_0.650794_1_plen_84_part_10
MQAARGAVHPSLAPGATAQHAAVSSRAAHALGAQPLAHSTPIGQLPLARCLLAFTPPPRLFFVWCPGPGILRLREGSFDLPLVW